MLHAEEPKSHQSGPHRAGVLRAMVLGANDGIVSTASLALGFVTASAGPREILIAAMAGMVAGSMSMAAGEYVSVSSQADMIKAAIERERQEISNAPHVEHAELVQIYEKRGLDRQLATAVAHQLMRHDALGSHTRDELGITEAAEAHPVLAALSSAAAFAAGGALTLLAILLFPPASYRWALPVSALLCLSFLGAVSARAGSAPLAPAILRIVFWSTLAMAVTAGVGLLFGSGG